jgi:hypothetical protein
MRYIKRFEGLITESAKTDLEEFCEINLAYLLDEDYKVTIKVTPFGEFTIDFQSNSSFVWNDIVDQFIPFLQRLSNEYTIGESIMIRFSEGFPNSHQTKMVRSTSIMNHDLMLDFLADTPIKSILLKVNKR